MAKSRKTTRWTARVKAQTIRLIDVFALGPFMIWAGTQLEDDWARYLMIAAGGATIAYNFNNFVRVAKGEDYTPHLHTQGCPEGFPVPPGKCIRPQ